MEIKLPKHKTKGDITISIEQLVVIGANGSGKTRFGSEIESNYSKKAHRISAQKSLSFPTKVRPTTLEEARNELKYGRNSSHPQLYEDKDYVVKNRWNGNPNTHLLNDYESLLVLLLTEEFEMLGEAKKKGILCPPTALDKVKRIWEQLLPHRKLDIKSGMVNSYVTNNPNKFYNASELSDGERVIFYLIAEVVCALPNSLLIFDEPEMHIHKSLVSPLFNLIEQERPDCSFVYLTHDIDFAFSRISTTKIWAKSYEGSSGWDYEILREEAPIPEQLYLEVLGSRKPVIFIEGDSSSIDYKLYSLVFNDFTLEPIGSCEKVINTVKAFNSKNSFHNIKSFGIVDRDRREQVDVEHLNSHNIWVLDVAEAENLFLLEEILKIVESHMGKTDVDIVPKVKRNLLDFFTLQQNQQILLHTKEVLGRKFKELMSGRQDSFEDMRIKINENYGKIDLHTIHEEVSRKFEEVVINQDYESALLYFNSKNSVIPQSKICELSGVRSPDEYKSLVYSLLRKNDTVSNVIRDAIKSKITGYKEL